MAEDALRVMVLEDEMLLALDMERTLRQLGHEVVGPFNVAADAQSSLSDGSPDLALLDVNLGNGEDSMPVAQILRDRAVPFAFLTGYAASATVLGDAYPGAPRLSKPCSAVALGEAITSLRAASASS